MGHRLPAGDGGARGIDQGLAGGDGVPGTGDGGVGSDIAKARAAGGGNRRDFLRGLGGSVAVDGAKPGPGAGFFRHWLQTASAYNEAMSLDGGNVAGGLLMVAAAVFACAIRVTTMNWPEDGRFKLRKKLLLTWLAAQIFWPGNTGTCVRTRITLLYFW